MPYRNAEQTKSCTGMKNNDLVRQLLSMCLMMISCAPGVCCERSCFVHSQAPSQSLQLPVVPSVPYTYRVLMAHSVCTCVSLQLADKKQRRKQSAKQTTEAHWYRVINQQPLQKTSSRPSHRRQPCSLPRPSLMPHVMLIQKAFQNNTEQHNGCSAQHNLNQSSAILIVQHNLMFGQGHLW